MSGHNSDNSTDSEKLDDRPKGIDDAEQGVQENGKEYPEGVKLGLIILALCLAVFLMALDNSIITTAIPRITDQFNSLDDVGWYGSAYLLTTAAFQLLFGKLYTYFNIKRLFLISIGIFELGSVVCGAAPNSTALIIGRAVAGLGSSGIFSGALLILGHSVPLVKRPAYIGVIGGMYGIASIAGPLLGGAFTDKVSWRWCFWVNLPVGAVTIFVIIFFFQSPNQLDIPKDETLLERINHFDPIGTFFFMPAIISLLLALQWGGTKYEWDSGRIIGLLVVFGILIMAFIYVQYRQKDNGTIPPRIAANRSIWAGCWFGFCSGATFFLMVYYIPLWFQAVQGTSAVVSGVRNLPMLITTIILSIISGGLVTKLGYYTPFMIASSVIMSIGAGMISTWKPDSSSRVWIGYQILFSLGYGMGSRQPLVAVQTVLDVKDVATGSSAIILVQTLGGTIFVSIAQSIFTNQLVKSLHQLVPSLDPATVLSAGATDLRRVVSAEMLPGVILAYNTALTRAFLASAALSAVSVMGALAMPWMSVKKSKAEGKEE
ncbi:major facilitator superfamily domain-containing protein [Clohesyomyces aquaticus]|uniref:Major facilitator superfamily domain-containing protein n=1 Tax=Clohesyomyces aquaticus TaxID=1231657 RepID=A0A1Y1YXT0_9PLEO|nr:major facilitator superfamily domain-containing protein [Clohesyomyces aquaticus]